MRPFLLFVVLLSLLPARVLAADTSPRERLSFNDGWLFSRTDAQWVVGQLDYATLKPWLLPTAAPFLGVTSPRTARPRGHPGGDLGHTQPGFDDSGWRKLDLPHDWAIEGPFKQEYPNDTGKLPWWGVAWYRKHFTLPATDAGRRIVLEIDGAMAQSVVWLNGHLVGGWPYGYASYQLDLTPYVKPGAENILAIRLDNPEASSRWYPGAGLYRNVWLTKTNPVHVAQWGSFVTTPQVAPEAASVSVNILADNDGPAPATISVGTELFALDASGQKTGPAVATGPARPVTIVGGRQASVTQTLRVPQPQLWSVDRPSRYVAVTTLTQEGRVVDRYETRFGIRTVAFDANRGFLLNGEVVPIRGVCNHHDLGALGAAINTRALERQLEILRAMGCNAIRTSHNPPAPELLDLCDRMGFLVMDEAFDCWAKGKNRQDYHVLFPDWHEADLRALIRRDRNHPSVVLWSIGNEIIEQWGDDAGAEGWKLANRLAGIVREEDRTRPISAAFNRPDSGYNGFQQTLDAVGYNYKVDEYAPFRTLNPTVPLFGAETASTVSSRGEYFFPVGNDKLDPASRVDFQVSSYDLYAPPWAQAPDDEWRAADAVPGYAGEFVWTGFDYLGEPTPYNADATNLLNFSNPAEKERQARLLAELGRIDSPSRSSYFGIVDLAGFPKDRYYLYQARWRPDLPMAHLLPHWTWPERTGQVTPVHAYTSGDEAELFLNGQSLGRKKRAPGEYRLRWDDVKYAAGEVRLVAYKAGAKWAEAVQRTAGDAARLKLKADRRELTADGQDLSFVTVRIEDADGVLVPRAAHRVAFEVTGPGEIVATDNGDPTSFESFQAKERAAFNGLVLVVVRTKPGEFGPITLRAKSAGLTAAEVSLTAK